MKLIKITFSALLLFAFCSVNAQQDDLMKELDSVPQKKEAVSAAFKGLQVCNIQSTKLPAKKEWYFLVSHRFGDLTDGLDTFFGLDHALTKIGGIYGATDWLSFGISRHTFQKTYEMTAKYRLFNQEIDGFPLTIVGYNTMDIRTDLTTDLYPDVTFNDKLAYTTQLIISRKFNENFSAEIVPIYVHKNVYDYVTEQDKLFLMGLGARYKISKRVSVNMEYAARLNLPEDFNSPYNNPASIGVDIDTGGHIFQLVLSNCQKMNDVSYYSTATGINNGKGIYFGFNLYRVF